MLSVRGLGLSDMKRTVIPKQRNGRYTIHEGSYDLYVQGVGGVGLVVIKDTKTDDVRVQERRRSLKEKSKSYSRQKRVVVGIIKYVSGWYIILPNHKSGGSRVWGVVHVTGKEAWKARIRYENPRVGMENLARSEQLLCPPSMNFFDLNWDGRMINHITH